MLHTNNFARNTTHFPCSFVFVYLSHPVPALHTMTQNKFVKDFTKEETDAVTKLKASLPDILKTAFKSEGEPEPYKLWDIALDKDSTDERLDVLLVKFLRAR